MPNLSKIDQFCYHILVNRRFQRAKVWVSAPDGPGIAHQDLAIIILDQGSHSFLAENSQMFFYNGGKNRALSRSEMRNFQFDTHCVAVFTLLVFLPKVRINGL